LALPAPDARRRTPDAGRLTLDHDAAGTISPLIRMAYVIFIANGEEIDRRELSGPVTVGRAPDCDIVIRDILLSRHHCRLEPAGRGWAVFDLHSKNGTHLHGHPVERHALKEGDELRMGRTRLVFRAGEFVPAPARARKPAVNRAVDPHEALSGTVSGMYVCEAEEVTKPKGMPFPQPRPAGPSSYQDTTAYGLVSDIASNSWDSIMAENTQPVRMQRAAPTVAVSRQQPRIAPKARVSFALQASDDHSTAPSANGAKSRNGKALDVAGADNAARGADYAARGAGDAAPGAGNARSAGKLRRPAPGMMFALLTALAVGLFLIGWMCLIFQATRAPSNSIGDSARAMLAPDATAVKP
jgi:pSer/pThr/pTyr-binding forkhead associated (FHA) protein